MVVVVFVFDTTGLPGGRVRSLAPAELIMAWHLRIVSRNYYHHCHGTVLEEKSFGRIVTSLLFRKVIQEMKQANFIC